jgi:hypothetical protein
MPGAHVVGEFAVGIGNGLGTGVGGGSSQNLRWERFGGQGVKSRLLFLGQRHLPGNLPVHIDRQLDVAVAHPVLDELGVGPRFDVRGDVRSPKITLADSRYPKRPQRREETPAYVLLVQWGAV